MVAIKSQKRGRSFNGQEINRRDMLLWIETRIKRNGYAPSVREIAAGFLPGRKLSTNTVHYHLSILEVDGLIERDGEPRGIKIVPQSHGA